MWQTPVSSVSPSKATPFASSSARPAATSPTLSAICAGWAEVDAGARGVPDAEAELADEDLEARRRVAVERQPERVHVELLRASGVLRLECDEIDLLDLHRYPTEPSICSWIRRFISTAYSSGSSFVIGSTKPLTIIADASVSESPRDIR